MNFIWGGDRGRINSQVVFTLGLNEPCTLMKLAAADSYQVFVDGEFRAYGPERTAAGFARVKLIDVAGAKSVSVAVIAANVETYEWDMQAPFFGAELYDGDRLVYTSADFAAHVEKKRLTVTPRYSLQRGFAEGYDLADLGTEPLATYPVEAPTLLEGIGERCDYNEVPFRYTGEKDFAGFERVVDIAWEKDVCPDRYGVYKNFVEETEHGYREINFELENERSGFLRFEIEAEEEGQVFVLFEEVNNERWTFRRNYCNEFVILRTPRGRFSLMTAEPYAMKFLKILCKNKIKITPSLIAYENDRANAVTVEADERTKRIFAAAHRTFCQNAVDVFTDCPGRERAGWLCDSYFTAKAELLFTGKNDIERAFLENFIISTTPELDPRMFPMCFPSEHTRAGTYIPNWAMWLVIELKDHLDRTGDATLPARAKERVMGLIDFFKRFKNSDGLLEDLESWVFLEWSISNDKEYVRGVNYPSNMLYAYMLDAAAAMYGDESLAAEAARMRRKIMELSFNGEFFCDNATRDENGKLIRRDDHISETCQYYALFTGLSAGRDYEEKIKTEFGPLRTDAYPAIGKSNMFIGNYLRFFWLAGIGEYDRVLHESLEYFSVMAEKTGTLWENDKPSASCNHGFASVAAVLLLRCLVGYETTENGAPRFMAGFKPKEGVRVKFNYN